MTEEKATKITKVKRKRWIQVLSPVLFGNEFIGEIPVSEPRSLIKRIVPVNLMGLTKDIKRQNTNIKFVITHIQGDKAITEFYSYYLNPNSIKRLVRRGKEKLGISTVYTTSDNKKIRIMVLIIPHTKVKGSVSAAFKKTTINFLASYTAKTTFEGVIKDLISTKLQKDLKAALKKVYPIRVLEISKLHIEKEKRPVEKKAEEKVELKEEAEEVKEEEKKAEEKEVKTETEEEKEVEQKEETEEEDEPEEELAQEPEE